MVFPGFLVRALIADDAQYDAMLYNRYDRNRYFHDGPFLRRVHFTIINMKYL